MDVQKYLKRFEAIEETTRRLEALGATSCSALAIAAIATTQVVWGREWTLWLAWAGVAAVFLLGALRQLRLWRMSRC